MNATSKTQSRLSLMTVLVVTALFASQVLAESPRLPLPDLAANEFRLLAANRTSTLQDELNQAAGEGFVFHAMMAGNTLGGKELVVVMSKPLAQAPVQRIKYKVLATNKTSTMQRELEAMGAFGYRYCAQSVAPTTFGGRQILVVLERNLDDRSARYEYQLLASNRTLTLQNELNEVAREGYQLAGLTVAETAFGGDEILAILSRR